MFNQETGSSTNYLIIACMLISFACSFPFFRNWMLKWWRKNWWGFPLIICLHLRVFIPKPNALNLPVCLSELRNKGGLNWRVVACLFDACKAVSGGSLWKHSNYLKHLARWRSRLVHMKAYALCLVSLLLLEIGWKWIDLSHCLKGAHHSSWTELTFS